MVPAGATAIAVCGDLSVDMVMLRVGRPTFRLLIHFLFLEKSLFVGCAVPVRSAGDAILEGDLGVVGKEGPRLGDVRTGALHVSRLFGEYL